jgi:hypothetical protein
MVDSVRPSADNDSSGKGPPPTVPPDGDPTGGPTPDAMIGGLFANIPPTTGTSNDALSTAIQKTPPKTAITLDHLGCKWMGLFQQFLAKWREQRAKEDRQRTQEDASLSTLKGILAAASASLSDAVNKAINPFKEEIKATVADIKAEVSGLDAHITTSISNIASLDT